MEILLLEVTYEDDFWYDFIQVSTEGRFESFPTPWVSLKFRSAKDCFAAALTLGYESIATDSEHPGTLFAGSHEPFVEGAALLLDSHGIRAEICEVIGVRADRCVLTRLTKAIADQPFSISGCSILFPSGSPLPF